ncbi:MAG: hypothetical protein BWX65_00622 [Bacteroidetes bacterium ADurb.Bin057]|nr:MAG: hypothetical protein BWX65_00622 [Bacteroidetes bacterium ADurb.Bin057]
MDKFAKIIVFGYCFQRSVAHIFRMRCGETHTHIGHRYSHFFKQFRKIDNDTVLLKTVRIDILPQKRNFFITTHLQIAHFVENACYIATAFAPTGVRHNAVGTKIVATAHNTDKARNAFADACRNNVFVSFSGGKFHIHNFFAFFGSTHKIGQIQISIGTGDKINAIIFYKFVLQSLCHATDNAY